MVAIRSGSKSKKLMLLNKTKKTKLSLDKLNMD